MFELKQLRYFIAVAENTTCNISQVAEELHIAQPNLSAEIKTLERNLDVELFDRSNPRRLKLTPAGKAFLEETRLVFTQIEQSINIAQRTSRGELGILRIGFNSSVSNSVLPDIIRACGTQFPEVKLTLKADTAHNLIESLQTQKIDIGLMHWSNSYEQNERICIELIKEEPLILVLPEEHPLASETEISLTSLIDEPFILPSRHLAYSLYEPIESFCKEQLGCVPDNTQEATFMLTMLSLVAGGIGVTMLPANVTNIQRKGVIYRKIKESTPTIQIVAAWREDNSSVVLSNFKALLRDINL